jgi:hypothetical protein
MLKTVLFIAMVVSLGAALLTAPMAQAVEVIPSLELRVNRLNGVTRIITTGTPATGGDTDGTANLDGYTIADSSGVPYDVWDPTMWTSITDTEGAPWEEVPPTGVPETQALSELNLTGFKPISSGDVISLGSIYETGTPVGAVSFTYDLDGSASTTSGTVVFFDNIAGDFDGNGVVDGNDFLTWQRDLGDATNLGIWQSNYGATALSAASAASAVPEPTSASLLIISLGALALVGYRRKEQ